jgi:hypothetical protein
MTIAAIHQWERRQPGRAPAQIDADDCSGLRFRQGFAPPHNGVRTLMAGVNPPGRCYGRVPRRASSGRRCWLPPRPGRDRTAEISAPASARPDAANMVDVPRHQVVHGRGVTGHEQIEKLDVFIGGGNEFAEVEIGQSGQAAARP